MTISWRTAFGAGFAMVTLAALAAGFYLVGSPGEARARRLDARREADLRSAATAIDVYWNREHALPVDLDAAARTGALPGPTRDPETAEAYEYRAIDATHYELCATFVTPSAPTPPAGDAFWSHTAGRQCFTLEARVVKR